jgi:hypothetical protein
VVGPGVQAHRRAGVVRDTDVEVGERARFALLGNAVTVQVSGCSVAVAPKHRLLQLAVVPVLLHVLQSMTGRWRGQMWCGGRVWWARAVVLHAPRTSSSAKTNPAISAACCSLSHILHSPPYHPAGGAVAG